MGSSWDVLGYILRNPGILLQGREILGILGLAGYLHNTQTSGRSEHRGWYLVMVLRTTVLYHFT